MFAIEPMTLRLMFNRYLFILAQLVLALLSSAMKFVSQVVDFMILEIVFLTHLTIDQNCQEWLQTLYSNVMTILRKFLALTLTVETLTLKLIQIRVQFKLSEQLRLLCLRTYYVVQLILRLTDLAGSHFFQYVV